MGHGGQSHGHGTVNGFSAVPRSVILPCEKKFESQGDVGNGLQQWSCLGN